MASDPSLIEISGEDDSLLQQIPTDDVARNFFSCSPLQIHGSKPRVPPVDSVNKENVNLNKYDRLKLSLEPQHMKRKKKGGGYNLRKSLAWDRAFFTEEGFLDPVELSMISANSGSSTGEKLPAIHEEGGESLSEFPNSQSDSGDVLALKEKLFKELPVNTTNESRTKPSSSPHQRDALTKCGRALVSSTKRKVLSNYDVNGSRSKRNGSSQSTALSSLIKPVNVNSTKVASKEVNASKKPATKPGSSLRTPTAKIALRVGQPKHSQLAQSGTADKKNAGLKISSSNKIHSKPSTPAGPSSKPPTTKSIVPQSKRNLGKSASRLTSLTRGNDSSQEIEGRKNPSALDNDARSIKVEAAHPEKARLTGGSIQHVQLKAAKPSGLRMPSPSLGFFGQQRKASTKGLLNSYTQPSYDPQSATGSSKSHRAVNPLSELKPPHVHEKVQKMRIDDTNPNMGLSTEVSAKSLNLEYQKQNADPESQNISKMKVKIQLDTLENHQKIHGFLEDGSEGLHRHMEMHKIDIKPQAEDRNMSVGYDTPFSHVGPCGKEKESNYKKNHMIGSQCVEGPSKVLAGNAIVFSNSPSADSSVGRIQSSFGLPDHRLHCAEGVSEFSEKVKLVESHIYDNDRTSIVNQENQARLMGVRSSEELQQNCEECTDNSNDQDDNGNKEERSSVLPLKLAEQADNGFCGLHDSSTKSYIENSENLVFYGSLTASHGGTSPAGDHAAEQVTCENKGAKENDELLVGAKCTMTIDEQPEVHAVEQVAYAKERATENDDILLIDFRIRGEHQDNALMIEYSPPNCQHACEVLLNSSTALSPVPPSENVDKAKRVILYAEENQSPQQESEPMVENSASFSDRQSTDNMYLPGQVDAFNLGSSLMVNRDPKTVAATDDTSASFVGLGIDRCSRVKEEDRYVSTPLASVVEDGDDNMLMELECDDEEVLLNSSTALCPEPPSENVHQSDKAKRVVLYAEENKSAQQESEPLVENSASFSDRQSTDNMYLPGQVDALNTGSSLMVNRDPKTVAATDDTSASFVGLGIDRCSGVKEEDRYVSTPLVSVVEDGDDNMLMELECDDEEVLLNSSTALCPEPPSENVHQSDKAKRVVLYAEENKSAQQESEPLVENSASFSDRQSTDNMYLPGQVDALNTGSSLVVNRDPKTVAATDDTPASFVGLGSDRCSGVKEEDRYVSTPLVSVVEDGDDNMLMELECDDVEVLLNNSTALSPEPPSENVHQSDKAKKVVLYAEENQSAQQESEPMVENSASFSDRRSTDNMYLPGQVDAFNPGSSLMVNRDPKTVAATDDTSASFVGLGSDRYSGVKEEYRYVSTALVSVVQDGDDNMLMELKECGDVEERQILQSEKNASVSLVTGRLLPDSLTGTELLSREVDNSSHEDRHSGSFGQHQKLKDCYLPNVSVHVEDPSWQDDVDQTNEELRSFDNAMKNSSAVVGQQQLLDGSSFIDCSLKMNGLAGDDNFSMASHRNEQSCYQPELHDPCFTAEFDSHTHRGLSSNDEISTVDNYLKEPKSYFASSCSLCQDDVCGSKHPKADICSQVEPVLQDNSGNIGTIYEDPNAEDVLSVSVQKYQSNIYNASLEDNAAVDMNIEEFPEAGVNVMVSSCRSSDKVVLDVKNDEAELPINNQCTEEASQLKSSILPEKVDSSVPGESFSYDVQRLHEFGSTLNSCKDTTTLVQGEICKNDGKQESAMVKPPPDAPPFSEEWLAAFEAAGEEILTMKCGAVQNSPPDKTLPEPSPWSPVKRKNNQAIGPYDCTKFTNVCNNIPECSSE
ncbi:uncharacterized protein LOC115752183 [Rhodamnia argentea]|uniref:Uncharacterized protein LOC115752183 n=1 Tax=Rhodamnia argentea TaxID=178133 RepID=A0A8B8QIN4_9MYRT|nr:uncharacterized protein LOC115752183 [Rhodamnia argentea]